MSHPLSLLLLLLPFLFITLHAQSITCPSRICGSINITYPFWILEPESTTRLCGYQGFGINCSQHNISRITLGNDSYYVRDISYELKTIFLADYDVSIVAPRPNNCPRVRHNISLGTSLPLVFLASTVNISFHFGCNECPTFATEIPCFSRIDERACVQIINTSTSTSTEEMGWDEYLCGQEVVTSVFGDTLDLIGDFPTNFSSALEKGFGLQWGRDDGCEKCEESGGRCGHQDTSGFMCFCPDGTTSMGHCKGASENTKMKLVIGVGSALLSIAIIFIMCCILKPRSSNCVDSLKHKTKAEKNIEAFVIHYGALSMTRYKYNHIKKMTNTFKVKLGQGGFGQVFKGTLSDGRPVAVKLLNSSNANGEEFINEVASIGRTAHVNIVTLLGFCFENKKRALVYEYMPKGSLEKFIHSHQVPSEHIGVQKLYEIALGIASGLDYLHRGCNTRILHLDIKPHNILLDEDFCPKIADFGLAKMYSRKESIVSMLEARGTIGYIAPEVYNKNFGGVSHKSDVYSYGMLLLEMVGGRKNIDAGVGTGTGTGTGRTSDEIYFPDWIYKCLHKDKFLLDDITNSEENEYARKMTIVGLWCIQPDPNQRPNINQVIEMLEGSMEALEVPPKPFFSYPSRSPAPIYSTSESMPKTT